MTFGFFRARILTHFRAAALGFEPKLPGSLAIVQFFRQCSQDTGLSHHTALALCKVLVVWARPWSCCSRSRSSASRPSIARYVRTRYTVFCILR